MKEHITNELVEATYLFCVKRISDTEAAKNLSQDILYEAIRNIAGGKEFVSFYSWYWKMARNKYADYIAHKQNDTLPIETAGGMAAEMPEPIENIVAAEDLSQLNFSLSRLASIHREIIIRFYLQEQPVSQIAKELGIPAGTVKRRLFDAKKNLKERFDRMNHIGKTAYAPVDVSWFWGYSAMKASLLMNSSKICPQIMVICREEAKTVNEIADEMGIAPVYLEEILEKMRKEQLLKSPVKGKYLANCCIFPRDVYVRAEIYACDVFHDNRFPERITEKLLDLKDQITSLDFYGNQFDYRYIMWILYVQAAYAFSDIGGKYYLRKHSDRYPKEADRTYNLTMHYVLPDDNDEHLGRDKWVDGTNISLLLDLAANPKKQLSVYEEEKAAEFLKNGLLKKENDSLIVQLPVLKTETANQIMKLIKAELTELAEEYVELVSKGIEELLLPYVRKDLMNCFINWDMHSFFEPKGALFYYGWDKSLAQPEDYSTSAAGLYVLTE